jgi:hypothetical protein
MMTLTIPQDLEQALVSRAQERQQPVADVVREALTWYLQISEASFDELAAWQEVRDEALRLVEDGSP